MKEKDLSVWPREIRRCHASFTWLSKLSFGCSGDIRVPGSHRKTTGNFAGQLLDPLRRLPHALHRVATDAWGVVHVSLGWRVVQRKAQSCNTRLSCNAGVHTGICKSNQNRFMQSSVAKLPNVRNTHPVYNFARRRCRQRHILLPA